MDYKILNAADHSDLCGLQTAVGWSEFILHDAVSLVYWEKLFTHFPTFQLVVLDDGEVVGTLNAIPLCVDAERMELDDRGWDWALEKGFADWQSGLEPTVLCGLQIGIGARYRGKGVSKMLIGLMKQLAVQHGLAALVLPIRPNMKHRYPLIKMEDYVGWTNDDGLPFDPWIRTHVKLGAQIKNVCRRAMHIAGSISEWESWTGMTFKTSGAYTVDSALVPINVSVEANKAEYVEPNIWMVHHL